MTGPNNGVIGELLEDPLIDGRNDRREIPAVEGRVARSPRKECVAGEEKRRIFEGKAD